MYIINTFYTNHYHWHIYTKLQALYTNKLQSKQAAHVYYYLTYKLLMH